MRRITLLVLSLATALVLVSGVAWAATKDCDDRTCTGTDGNDTLVGNEADQTIFGRGGDDTLKGLGGADYLRGDGKIGESGNDKLFGGSDSDTLYGDAGNNILRGEAGKDIYLFQFNSRGRDTIIDDKTLSRNSIDVVASSTSKLIINLDSSPNVSEVRDAAGTRTVNWSGDVIDQVFTYGPSADTVRGNAAANLMESRGNRDSLYGVEGNDEINVFDRVGGDIVDCGAGNDVVIYDTGDTVSNCEDMRENGASRPGD